VWCSNCVVLKQCGAQTVWCSNSVVLKLCGAQTVWCSYSVVLIQCGAQTVWCSNSVVLELCCAQIKISTLHLESNQNTKKILLFQVQSFEAVEVCCGV